VNTLGRAFNVREGFGRKDDYLPERLATEPLRAGASHGQRTTRQDQDNMLDRYYELYGYDRNGVPTRKRLLQLGLEGTAGALQSMGLLPS
jgi:aldehyde:ferredoxin oxidoreductase